MNHKLLIVVFLALFAMAAVALPAPAPAPVALPGPHHHYGYGIIYFCLIVKKFFRTKIIASQDLILGLERVIQKLQ